MVVVSSQTPFGLMVQFDAKLIAKHNELVHKTSQTPFGLMVQFDMLEAAGYDPAVLESQTPFGLMVQFDHRNHSR